MYQKEIIYMNLLKNEVKTACVGFLKYQQKGNQYQVEIQLKNVTAAMSGSFPIRLQSGTGWQETGMLILNEGKGRWTGTLSEEIMRAEIILSDAYKVKGQSKNAEKPVIEDVHKAEDKLIADKEIKSSTRADKEITDNITTDKEIKDNMAVDRKMMDNAVADREIKSSTAADGKIADDITVNKSAAINITAPNKIMPEQISASKSVAERPTAVAKEPEGVSAGTVMRAESMTMPQKRIPNSRPAVRKEHAPLYENKWEQLLATYEQIHPYADNRIYVKLEPKDFIILRENYQHLVNNSFLLHGFYNYRYLILGKEQDFYLGVPGVFYEREKMVALMFGFEAFECEGGEAEEGKFGYYLRKVEL